MQHKIIEEGSLEHQLLECCRSGSLEEVRALLDAGAAADAGLPNINERGGSRFHGSAEGLDVESGVSALFLHLEASLTLNTVSPILPCAASSVSLPLSE